MKNKEPYKLFGTTEEGLSRGPGAKQFNPLLLVELRRWRARPLTYSLFVIIAFAGIMLNRYVNASTQDSILVTIGLQFPNPDVLSNFTENNKGLIQGLPFFGELLAEYLMGFNNLNYLLHTYITLLLRPSTIIPLLMVWRALITFGQSGYYKSLRMTFLHQRDFIWGIVTIPFWISAVILVLYVGIILSPNLAMRYYAISPTDRFIHPIWTISGILFEGATNGALICFLALYLGLRNGATLLNIFPVLLFILIIQFIMAIYLVQPQFINDLILPAPDDWRLNNEEVPVLYRGLLSIKTFLVMGIPKLVACVVLYQLTLRLLNRGADLDRAS
ncbi:MAG: hypothetical protein ACFCU1_05140 [Sumerlaeia bacterium]